MQYVDVAREHRGKLAGQRIDPEVYRAARHRVFERHRAGNAERPQPREALWKITELPKKIPGRIASGPLAPTPWAPECPMAQLKPADTSISCRSLRYTSPFTERLVVSKPNRWAPPQLR